MSFFVGRGGEEKGKELEKLNLDLREEKEETFLSLWNSWTNNKLVGELDFFLFCFLIVVTAVSSF